MSMTASCWLTSTAVSPGSQRDPAPYLAARPPDPYEGRWYVHVEEEGPWLDDGRLSVYNVRSDSVQIWLVAVLHIDKVVLVGLADCVSPGGKMKGLMASMVNATKTPQKRVAKKGLSTDGCMQLTAEVGHLVRLLAQAQPEGTGTLDVLSLMSVPQWAEVRLQAEAAENPATMPSRLEPPARTAWQL